MSLRAESITGAAAGPQNNGFEKTNKMIDFAQCEVIYEFDRRPFMRTSQFALSPSLAEL